MHRLEWCVRADTRFIPYEYLPAATNAHIYYQPLCVRCGAKTHEGPRIKGDAVGLQSRRGRWKEGGEDEFNGADANLENGTYSGSSERAYVR